MSFRPHHFGRYTILDPIAVGGMAEIYRARLTNTADAPDRILIIKKIISALSSNNDFVEMFEGEIKITVGLSHPNIVQIFDYGRVDGVSFLAMEYVEGKNLRQFLKRLISMKSMFSIDMSCYIVSQVCNALAYAHAFKDRMTGEHLGIVHRDVSPQNVMISYDGAVKLFDFGIAKAKSASEATQAGVIKGKPSYLSPEQIAGETLDGRSDIFSLGIVLWEMLTAKRLFVADNDMAILRMIQSAKIESPSVYNPAIPQALDAIVLRGLARDRDKRYRTAEEMQRDLHRFLYSFNPGFNPADLSYYATELFKKEISEDRERLRAALKLQPDPNPLAPKKPEAAVAAVKAATIATEPSKIHETATEGLLSSVEFNREVMEDMLMSKTSIKSNDPQIELSVKKPGTNAAAGAAKRGRTVSNPSAKGASGQKKSAEDLVIPPWVNQAKSGSRKTNTGLHEAIVERKGRSKPGSRSIALDRAMGGGGLGGPTVGLFGALVAIVTVVFIVGLRVAPGMFGSFVEGTPLAILLPAERNLASPKKPVEETPPLVDKSQVPQPIKKTSEPVPLEDVFTTVRLESNEPGVSVQVNGRSVNLSDNTFSVAVGIDLLIEISKPGFDTKSIQTKFTTKDPQGIKVVMQKIEKGFLTFFTNPGADITLRSPGRKVVSTFTPVKKLELPVGEYEAVIENSRINYKSTIKFRIEQGKVTSIEKDL